MTSRYLRVAWLAGALRRGLIIFILAAIVLGQVAPQLALAYRESAMELVAGNLIVQNQSYSTSTKQNLFHSQSEAGTDTEAFSFGRSLDGGINLAQTASDTGVAQETGFFNSTASADVVLPIPLSEGIMGTFIADPITVGLGPAYSGLIFPQMIKTEDLKAGQQGTGGKSASTKTASANTAGSNSTAGNSTLKNLTFQPVIDSDLSSGTPGSSNATDPNAESNAGKIESRQESPRNRTNGTNIVLKPQDPQGHQTNKPFVQTMAPASGPLKASRDLVENLTSWDRFMMNTIGRSTTDKSINGTISRPVDIRPDKTLAPFAMWDYIKGALSLTKPGSHLSNRQWPL